MNPTLLNALAMLVETYGALNVLAALADGCDSCGDVMESGAYHRAASWLRETREHVQAALKQPDAVRLGAGLYVLAEMAEEDEGEGGGEGQAVQ